MSHERILMVEDDSSVAQLVERCLRNSGYSVCAVVPTGEEAIVEVRRLQPDLVLMDITLPGKVDGVETAGRIRDQFNIPVVFLTGMGDEATMERAQQAGAFGFLLKPFRPEEVKAGIDIALEKHRSVSALQRIEQWFSAAIRSISDAVITTSETGTVTFLNPVAAGLAGWEVNDAIGRPLGDVFRVTDAAGRRVADDFQRPVMQEQRPVRLLGALTLHSQRQTTLPIEADAAPIRNDQGQVIGMVLVFRDITERVHAEAEVSRSREQLRSLAAHLQSVREEERTRISREIHDELGQMLTGLKMDLAWIERRLAAHPYSADKQSLADKTRSMGELLGSMVQSVRKISAELRPGVLDDLGLVPALEWQARDFQSRTGIECCVHSNLGPHEIPPTVGTAVFRIFQESLTNAARHAQASRVEASLESDGARLRLVVRDNGRGISDTAMVNLKSFGLVGMRERANHVGGEFAIAGETGAGTTVTVQIPLSPAKLEP